MKRMADKMYVYALINPIDDQVFYIGQSKNVQVRVLDHVHKCHLKRTPKDEILLQILAAGLFVKHQILEEIAVDLDDKLSIFNVSEREKYWVNFYKEKGVLSNIQIYSSNIKTVKVDNKTEKGNFQCLYCKKPSVFTHKRKRFCSDKCRVYWNRENKVDLSEQKIDLSETKVVPKPDEEIKAEAFEKNKEEKFAAVEVVSTVINEIPPMPVKLPGEDGLVFAARKNEWKRKYATQ